MADDDILKDAKEAFELIAEREADNRREALDDLRFARLADQWPEKVRRQRELEGRPCLTINKLPPFIRQVVNDARQNKPSIKVHPADSNADPKTAEVYDGLIRNIEVTSRADVAYDTALDFAVTMGFGYFRINTEYACDDTFDLDLVIKRIANPFSVYGDPYSTESDSSDWNSAFVTELMTKAQFRTKYKGAEEADWDATGYERLQDPWRDDDRILVAEYFRRSSVKKTVLLLSDQSVVAEEVYIQNKPSYDAMGVTVVGSRSSLGHKVTQRIMTGAEVLEENKWAGKFIPIIPVYGDEVNVEGKRYFRSLVRDAKDPARMFNFWRTASTELVALAPRVPFIGPKGSFTTDGAKWATANSESHAFIEYDGQIPPQRQPFASLPAGALQEALNASDDMKAITGIFDPSLGARSNETSGRAIIARQREGDVSTFHFIDNLSRAIEHAGRILIDLIPLVYKGERIIRVLGPQSAVSTVKLNVPVPVPDGQGNVLLHVYDLGRGKYDLTVETGPSFTTRREEAASQMTELIRAYPAAAPVLGDLLAKNLDWPEADEIAKRLQALLPAAANGGDGQAGAMVAKLQQQLALLMAQLQRLRNDRALDAEKLRIDAFKAETDRLKLTADIAQKGSLGGAFSFGPGTNAQGAPPMGTMTARRTVRSADSP
ncbi:MAG TPA: portal protein, partial [Micropepsaceae bacterium]|nr:portal protein [Micropepsaceae bacterium]